MQLSKSSYNCARHYGGALEIPDLVTVKVKQLCYAILTSLNSHCSLVPSASCKTDQPLTTSVTVVACCRASFPEDVLLLLFYRITRHSVYINRNFISQCQLTEAQVPASTCPSDWGRAWVPCPDASDCSCFLVHPHMAPRTGKHLLFGFPPTFWLFFLFVCFSVLLVWGFIWGLEQPDLVQDIPVHGRGSDYIIFEGLNPNHSVPLCFCSILSIVLHLIEWFEA